MQNDGDELQILLGAGSDGSEPIGLMQVDVACAGNAAQVDARAREVLAMILTAARLDRLPREEWELDLVPTVTSLMVRWFDANVSSGANSEHISSMGGERDWRWRHSRVDTPDHLVVYIEISAFPVSGFDALRSLLVGCGATAVTQGPSVSLDDVELASR